MEQITEEYIIYPKDIARVKSLMQKIERLERIENPESIYNQCNYYLITGTQEQLNQVWDLNLVWEN